MFKYLKENLGDLTWTLGGTGLVLITLSGETQKWGFWISGISLLVYIIAAALNGEDK